MDGIKVKKRTALSAGEAVAGCLRTVFGSAINGVFPDKARTNINLPYIIYQVDGDMETNDKLMTLLRLMDEPEAMTEAQLQELLSDEEVRKAYDVMADCKKLYQKPQQEPLSVKWLQLGQRFRMAAVFLGAVLLCGLAWAIIPHIISSHTDSPQSAQVTAPLTHKEGQGYGSSVRFDDVRLDSILTVVSVHYGKAVSFRDEEAKGKRHEVHHDMEPRHTALRLHRRSEPVRRT